MLFSEGLYAELPLALRGDPSAVIGRAYDRARQGMLSTEEYMIGDPEENGDDGDGSDAAAAEHANDAAPPDKMKGGIPLLSTRRSGLLSNFFHVGQFGKRDLQTVCVCWPVEHETAEEGTNKIGHGHFDQSLTRHKLEQRPIDQEPVELRGCETCGEC